MWFSRTSSTPSSRTGTGATNPPTSIRLTSTMRTSRLAVPRGGEAGGWEREQRVEEVKGREKTDKERGLGGGEREEERERGKDRHRVDM